MRNAPQLSPLSRLLCSPKAAVYALRPAFATGHDMIHDMLEPYNNLNELGSPE